MFFVCNVPFPRSVLAFHTQRILIIFASLFFLCGCCCFSFVCFDESSVLCLMLFACFSIVNLRMRFFRFLLFFVECIIWLFCNLSIPSLFIHTKPYACHHFYVYIIFTVYLSIFHLIWMSFEFSTKKCYQ